MLVAADSAENERVLGLYGVVSVLVSPLLASRRRGAGEERSGRAQLGSFFSEKRQEVQALLGPSEMARTGEADRGWFWGAKPWDGCRGGGGASDGGDQVWNKSALLRGPVQPATPNGQTHDRPAIDPDRPAPVRAWQLRGGPQCADQGHRHLTETLGEGWNNPKWTRHRNCCILSRFEMGGSRLDNCRQEVQPQASAKGWQQLKREKLQVWGFVGCLPQSPWLPAACNSPLASFCLAWVVFDLGRASIFCLIDNRQPIESRVLSPPCFLLPRPRF